MERNDNSSLNGPLGKEWSQMKLINDNDRQIIEIVIYVFLCSFVNLFGIVANVINLVVFYKQGLNTTINISFFALAVSDLTSLILQQWFCILINPLMETADLILVPSELKYITAGVPRVACARITLLITVYITAERCLCIAFPLHVKRLITAQTTAIAMVIIFTVTILFTVPLFATNTITWKFYPQRNKTLLGDVPTANRETVQQIIYICQSIIGLISFIAVITFTSILIRKLRQKRAWRINMSVDKEQSESISIRDRRTMNLVVLIASILIVCNTPGSLLFMATFVVSELSSGGVYSNLFFSTWSFAFLFEAVNSSVNIFLYFKMSTKYRTTCKYLFLKLESRLPKISLSALNPVDEVPIVMRR